MDVHWHDIADKVKVKLSKKLVRETIVVFYNALESNIDYDCNIYVRNIGRFKGTKAGIRRRNATIKYRKNKVRFREKYKKKRQRLWVKEKFDPHWPD